MTISVKNLSFIKPQWLLVLPVLFLLLIPKAALGDMLTPRMQIPKIQLLFGNILLGILEGILISIIFKTPKRKTIYIMIAANYVSMIVGGISQDLLDHFLLASFFRSVDIYNFVKPILFSVVTYWSITILLEWPFCLRALKGKKEIFRHSIYAVLLSQTLSYIVVVLFYFWIGSYGNNEIQLDRNLSFVQRYPASIYYIDPEDGDIYRIRIDGSNKEKVLTAGIRNDTRARLYARKEDSDPNWSLCCVSDDVKYQRDINNDETYEHILIASYSNSPVSQRPTKEYSDIEVSQLRYKYGFEIRGLWDHDEEPDTFYNCGPTADLRSEYQKIWEVGTCSYMKAHALLAENTQTGEEIRIAYDMPFLGSWMSRNATVLPGEIVVYQLDDQIVVLDLENKKMGLLTRGLGPIVVLEGCSRI